MSDSKRLSQPLFISQSYSDSKDTLPTSSTARLNLQMLQSDLLDLKQQLTSFFSLPHHISRIPSSITKDIRSWCQKYDTLLQQLADQCSNFQVALINMEYNRKWENGYLMSQIQVKQEEIDGLKQRVERLVAVGVKVGEDQVKGEREGKMEASIREIQSSTFTENQGVTLPYKFQTKASYVFESNSKYIMTDQHTLSSQKFKTLLLKERYSNQKAWNTKRDSYSSQRGPSPTKRNMSDLILPNDTDDQTAITRTPKVQKNTLDQLLNNLGCTTSTQQRTNQKVSNEQTPQIISNFLSTLRMF